MKTDPRVDAYLAKAPPFAQPILQEARQRIRKAFADVEETIKWNVPFFIVGGKILASMAAFKKHVKVGVWVGETPTFQDVTAVDELTPAKEFAAQLKAAANQSAQAMTSHPVKTSRQSKPAVSNAAKPTTKKAPAKKTSSARAPNTTSKSRLEKPGSRKA